MSSHLPDGLSPDAVDTLTELTSILTRLRGAQAATAAAASSSTAMLDPLGALGSLPGAASSAGLRGATPAPGPGAVTGTTPLTGGVPNSTSTTSLSIKELPAATDNLKHKLQRARAAVKTLPDITRSIAQQQAEIEELEQRRRQQLAMLAKVKGAGLQFSLAEQNKEDEGERMVE